jgi:GDP/UDP-N,N'-diacetylbacillosamine 2-epimerase (hydrolysing)
MIAVGICAHFMNIRIAHIFGGDVTNGSLDDSIRHCLTKLSDYHFVTSKESKKRVMQLGEINKNIFLVGNPGLDSIKKINFLDKKYFEKKYLIKFKKQIAFVTIHPDASNRSSTIKLTENLLKALIELKDFTLIFSKPNADIYSDEVMSRIKKFVYENNNAYYFDNLGHQKFLSLLKLSNFMIGNSSAGLSEMPYFRTNN